LGTNLFDALLTPCFVKKVIKRTI